MMRDDDDDTVELHGDAAAEPTRDSRGRWRKGHCPNPKGRPRKKPKEYPDLADIHFFGNTLIEIRVNGQTELVNRRAALLHKMYEDAMKGKVSMQKFLFHEFEKNDERLAAIRVRYDRLVIDWIINNPNPGKHGNDIPFEAELEMVSLRAALKHYFPGSYKDP